MKEGYIEGFDGAIEILKDICYEKKNITSFVDHLQFDTVKEILVSRMEKYVSTIKEERK